MDFAAHISYRPAYTGIKVVRMRFLRFLQAAYLLHLMAMFSIIMVFFFGKRFLNLLEDGGRIWNYILYGFAGLYFLTLIFFSLFDARSRYQNYKMAKDRLFQYGFDTRLLKPFMYSRCQRDAIRAAAKDLNLEKEFKQLTYKMGFRWYHILPYIVVQNPLILFTKDYWNKTLFVRTYHSKYFLW